MGRHTNFGQLVAHDVMNGIDHAHIAPELTVENWESKAIMRGGNYVWVLKGTHKDEQGDEITGYYVRVYASTPTHHRNGPRFSDSPLSVVCFINYAACSNVVSPKYA